MLYSEDDMADSSLAFTIKPIFDEYVYKPKNGHILKKLNKIFNYEKLHVTICCTFINDKYALNKLAECIVSSGRIVFDVNPVLAKNKKSTSSSTRSCMIQLAINNEQVGDTINHIRESSLRGLQKSEYKKQLKYPTNNNYHMSLKIDENTIKYIQYIKQIEAKTIFLKEFGYGKNKTFEYPIHY